MYEKTSHRSDVNSGKGTPSASNKKNQSIWSSSSPVDLSTYALVNRIRTPVAKADGRVAETTFRMTNSSYHDKSSPSGTSKSGVKPVTFRGDRDRDKDSKDKKDKKRQSESKAREAKHEGRTPKSESHSPREQQSAPRVDKYLTSRSKSSKDSKGSKRSQDSKDQKRKHKEEDTDRQIDDSKKTKRNIKSARRVRRKFAQDAEGAYCNFTLSRKDDSKLATSRNSIPNANRLDITRSYLGSNNAPTNFLPSGPAPINSAFIEFDWCSLKHEVLQDLDFIARLPNELVLDYDNLEKSLPPISASRALYPSLFLDLDETLIHTCILDATMTEEDRQRWTQKADLIFYSDTDTAVVTFRPWARQFLAIMTMFYEVIIYTAAVQPYADLILEDLDGNPGWIDHRLYRHHCTQYGEEEIYFKDLHSTGRDLAKSIIVDNRLLSFGLNVSNGVFIPSFIDDTSDEELLKLIPVLIALSKTKDVRYEIKERFRLFDLLQQYTNGVLKQEKIEQKKKSNVNV